MELVIRLSDKEYNELRSASYYSFDKYTAYLAMKNGTPLPEHHGRLIDKDKMIADLLTVNPQFKELIDWCLQVTEAQPTIIEGSDSK